MMSCDANNENFGEIKVNGNLAEIFLNHSPTPMKPPLNGNLGGLSRSPSPLSSCSSSSLNLTVLNRPDLFEGHNGFGEGRHTPGLEARLLGYRAMSLNRFANDSPDLLEDHETRFRSPMLEKLQGYRAMSLNRFATPDRFPVKRRPRRSVEPRLATHLEPATASSYLSIKISEFLQRTDHVAQEWARVGKKSSVNGEDKRKFLEEDGLNLRLRRSSSAANIAIKGLQILSRSRSNSRCNSRPPSRCEGRAQSELSEMTVDLAEEHSTATVASERLEIETSERLRLEKELQEIQIKNKRLQENGERLELEVLHLHSADVNGSALHSEDDDDESGDRTGVYKRRYERVARELEFAKRRLDQQHQDDLEQLIGLRKQLEKKLADAYEEVEEQRQVVAQWKRKVQKLNSELNDVRLLLEEQNSRNILLEKKQRKFDAELQMLQDELRQERQQKERSSREREIAVSEKYSMEQTLSAVKLELELKEQKLVNLNRELEELMFNGSTEEEVANLKKSKHQLDNKIKDQEEELDDLAGQVQMLEQAKLKLEMSLEQMRKEHRRELMQKDDEIEDARCSAVKKVKALECQLESEHEERTLLLRERHELERRLNDLEDRERVNRTSDQEQLNRLRRDLKRTKALLQDAQIMLQQAKADTPNKTILRQLRNQLEDAECARNLAIKARQTAEADLLEVQLALEEATRAKNEAEEKSAVISRERSQLQTQLDENEEELAEVLKKYRATVQQLSSEQSQLREQVGKIVELETERQSLKEQLNEMTSRLENVGSMNDPVSSLTVKRLELKCKELESKLELEQTTRSRMEVQISRLKETVERLQSDTDIAKGREAAAQDLVRKLQRNIRDLKEQLSQHESRENSETVKRKELEKRLEESEAETSAAKTDLRLALQRIEDLQLAIQGELDQDDEDDDSATDSDNSASSDESFESFLTNHNSGSADRSSVIRSNFSRSEEVSPLKITNSSASAKESSSPPSSFA
ncbi:unconventional myosin-XVIIIb isoform X6 [Bemisia tabaci]|uniref:unconventional myosin-XVIIIb isoform X6 n=1 Tax=Bemisia tabaci TaxID=7038 RepID=UPI003B28211E